jgi:IclR family acetate operon transcriptional repressor
MSTSKTHPPGTQSISRTLAILECFVDASELGVTEIATLTDLRPSTAHRIVRSLVAHGYLEQNPATDRYRLGRSAVVLGQAARSHRGLDLAVPLLEQLGAETGESVNMGLLDGDDVVVMLRVSSAQPLRFEQPVGTRLAAHCSSMGKALLAFGSPDGPADIAHLDLRPVTANTITELPTLAAELDEIRHRGYSTDHQESIVGVSCVGAPILGEHGPAVGAIAVQAPTARMPPERMATLGPRTVEVAATIAELMPPRTPQRGR